MTSFIIEHIPDMRSSICLVLCISTIIVWKISCKSLETLCSLLLKNIWELTSTIKNIIVIIVPTVPETTVSKLDTIWHSLINKSIWIEKYI